MEGEWEAFAGGRLKYGNKKASEILAGAVHGSPEPVAQEKLFSEEQPPVPRAGMETRPYAGRAWKRAPTRHPVGSEGSPN